MYHSKETKAYISYQTENRGGKASQSANLTQRGGVTSSMQLTCPTMPRPKLLCSPMRIVPQVETDETSSAPRRQFAAQITIRPRPRDYNSITIAC